MRRPWRSPLDGFLPHEGFVAARNEYGFGAGLGRWLSPSLAPASPSPADTPTTIRSLHSGRCFDIGSLSVPGQNSRMVAARRKGSRIAGQRPLRARQRCISWRTRGIRHHRRSSAYPSDTRSNIGGGEITFPDPGVALAMPSSWRPRRRFVSNSANAPSDQRSSRW
jgi:hypothetical protein